MKPQQFEEELRKTLVDQRLSRSEKRALAELVAEIDPADLPKLRSIAFDVARRELADDKRTKNVLGWLEEVNKTLLPDPQMEEAPPSGAFFSPGDKPLRKILGLLGSVRKAADICVFTITDNRIAEAILEAQRRGVRLRIVSDDDKAFDRGSDIQRLREAGIAVRVDHSPNHMHHKFAIFDERTLLTGSYNWTRSAASHNQENVVVTADPRLVGAFGEMFERLWSDFA
jgi:phosphatidylserine/phosphatidylglycerophosphate/cardiolipin synthase-like enzyme